MPKKKKSAKTKRNKQKLYEEELYSDCDGTFAFIAGYTDGGAPYGLQWWEIGIDPDLPFEEKVWLYQEGRFEDPIFESGTAEDYEDIFS